MYTIILFGLIAQWIEHPPSKRTVAGSNPAQSVLLNVSHIKKREQHLLFSFFLSIKMEIRRITPEKPLLVDLALLLLGSLNSRECYFGLLLT